MLLLIALPIASIAQEDADYRMEIGAGVGAGFYMGDLNNTMFTNQRPAAAAYWRYLFDHHQSLKVALTYAAIKGDTGSQDNYYPIDPASGHAERIPLKADFKGSVADLSCMYELNFFPYGYYEDFTGDKRFTPFLQLGLGLTYTSQGKEAAFSVPMGVGVKYRLSKRINIALDWTYHFTTSDKLDGYQDPLGIKSSGFKNKDHFSVTMLTLTYSFSPRCPNCNKY